MDKNRRSAGYEEALVRSDNNTNITTITISETDTVGSLTDRLLHHEALQPRLRVQHTPTRITPDGALFPITDAHLMTLMAVAQKNIALAREAARAAVKQLARWMVVQRLQCLPVLEKDSSLHWAGYHPPTQTYVAGDGPPDAAELPKAKEAARFIECFFEPFVEEARDTTALAAALLTPILGLHLPRFAPHPPLRVNGSTAETLALALNLIVGPKLGGIFRVGSQHDIRGAGGVSNRRLLTAVNHSLQGAFTCSAPDFPIAARALGGIVHGRADYVVDPYAVDARAVTVPPLAIVADNGTSPNRDIPTARARDDAEDPLTAASAALPELRAALAAIALNWHQQGAQLCEVPAFAKFTDWSATLGGVLVAAGFAAPLRPLVTVKRDEDEDTEFECVVRALQKAFDRKYFKSGQARLVLDEAGVKVEGVEGDDERERSRKLGGYLTQRDGCEAAGMRLICKDDRANQNKYRLEPVEEDEVAEEGEPAEESAP